MVATRECNGERSVEVATNSTVIVVPTGPRGLGEDPDFACNATYWRLLAGYERASLTGAILFVTGYPGERVYIEREMEAVRQRLSHLEVPRSFLLGHGAQHSAANVCEVLSELRYRHGPFAIEGEWYSHDWHLRRLQMLVRRVQELYRQLNSEWADAEPFAFSFHPVKCGLDPYFANRYSEAEPRKYRQGVAFLKQWRELQLDDAPTLFSVVASGVPARHASPHILTSPW